MHFEIDLWIGVLAAFFVVMFIRYKPSVDNVHSLVELANTKGGIILILWITSLIFFVAGLRLSYWGLSLQQEHPSDTVMAYINTVFSWISGGAFMGAFGAMIATMKGESLPPATKQEKTETVTVTTTLPPPAPLPTPPGSPAAPEPAPVADSPKVP